MVEHLLYSGAVMALGIQQGTKKNKKGTPALNESDVLVGKIVNVLNK